MSESGRKQILDKAPGYISLAYIEFRAGLFGFFQIFHLIILWINDKNLFKNF